MRVERLHSEELYALYSLPPIIRVVKSGRMRWSRHVALWEREEVRTGFWWGDLRERDRLEDLSVNHRHQVLLLFVEHRASMKSFHALRFPALPLTSFHDLRVPLIPSSIVLRHVIFGLPLRLYPWGFQSNAVFFIAPTSLRNVCPIQFHFLLFIWFSIGFCWVILHSLSFVILAQCHTFMELYVRGLFKKYRTLIFSA